MLINHEQENVPNTPSQAAIYTFKALTLGLPRLTPGEFKDCLRDVEKCVSSHNDGDTSLTEKDDKSIRESLENMGIEGANVRQSLGSILGITLDKLNTAEIMTAQGEIIQACQDKFGKNLLECIMEK